MRSFLKNDFCDFITYKCFAAGIIVVIFNTEKYQKEVGKMASNGNDST